MLDVVVRPRDDNAATFEVARWLDNKATAAAEHSQLHMATQTKSSVGRRLSASVAPREGCEEFRPPSVH